MPGASDKPDIVLSVAGQVFGGRTEGVKQWGSEDETKALQAQIEKLEKIIGRQTIAIEALKKTQELISGKKTKLMREKAMSLKSACEAVGISRSGQYRKVNKRQDPDRDEVLVERLKELRSLHPFWGYRRMAAWAESSGRSFS